MSLFHFILFVFPSFLNFYFVQCTICWTSGLPQKRTKTIKNVIKSLFVRFMIFSYSFSTFSDSQIVLMIKELACNQISTLIRGHDPWTQWKNVLFSFFQRFEFWFAPRDYKQWKKWKKSFVLLNFNLLRFDSDIEENQHRKPKIDGQQHDCHIYFRFVPNTMDFRFHFLRNSFVFFDRIVDFCVYG